MSSDSAKSESSHPATVIVPPAPVPFADLAASVETLRRRVAELEAAKARLKGWSAVLALAVVVAFGVVPSGVARYIAEERAKQVVDDYVKTKLPTFVDEQLNTQIPDLAKIHNHEKAMRAAVVRATASALEAENRKGDVEAILTRGEDVIKQLGSSPTFTSVSTQELRIVEQASGTEVAKFNVGASSAKLMMRGPDAIFWIDRGDTYGTLEFGATEDNTTMIVRRRKGQADVAAFDPPQK